MQRRGGAEPRKQMIAENAYAGSMRAALGVTQALRVEIFSVTQAMAYEDGWQNLATRALERNIFYEPAFALAAAQHLTEAVQPGFIFVFEAGQVPGSSARILGIFPFTTSKLDMGLPILRGWRHAFGPLGTPLLDKMAAASVLEAVFAHLENASFKSFLFSHLVQDGKFSALMRQVLAARGGQVELISSHQRAILRAGLDPDAYFLQNWRAKKLKELQRQRRRLQETGVLEWRSASNPPDIAAAVERFLVLEAAGWKGRKGSALMARCPVRCPEPVRAAGCHAAPAIPPAARV